MGVPSVAWCYPNQDDPKVLKVYADSDWAGDLESRRSTTAVLELLGSHPIDCCSVTQGAIALSSGEAELETMSRGAAGGLQTRAILKGFGQEVEFELLSDSSAGRAMTQRRGAGRVRHLEAKDLWL